jgi:cytochrome c553
MITTGLSIECLIQSNFMKTFYYSPLKRVKKWSTTAAIRTAAVLTLLSSFSQMSFAGMEEGRLKAQVCTSCHGVDGNSVSSNIPSIAAQPKQFIVTALYMYREGQRKSDVMSVFAEKLSNADLNDLAQYFSSQKLTSPVRDADATVIAKGKEITEKNNCVACHTANLTGQQHIPRLAGQHQNYLFEQLKLFKAAQRADFDGTMTSAAQALRSEELEVLSEYLSTLNK